MYLHIYYSAVLLIHNLYIYINKYLYSIYVAQIYIVFST